MQDYLAFLILGLGSGGGACPPTQGLVMIQKASGVINFAQGAMAMYGIYTYVELRDTGRLVHPILGLTSPTFGRPLSFWPAFLLALAMAAALGAAVYFLVMRPLRDASVLARVVALIGVLVSIEGLALVRFGWPGQESKLVMPILPDDSVRFLDIAMPQDRLWIAGLLLCVGLALAALYRFTRFGLATRAASDTEKGAVLVGLDPTRLALLNWVLATVVSTVFGILATPYTTLSPPFLVFLVVPALAAALVARFESFLVAAAAGVAIGAAQSALLKLQIDVSWLPRSGLQTGLPLLVIIMLVPLMGKRIVAREPLRAIRLALPREPRHVGATVGAGLLVGLVAVAVLPSAYRLGLTVSMIGAVVCLSFVVITGYGGQISLAQMALAGISGFTLSHVGSGGLGLPFPLAPLVAVAVAAALGTLMGIPSLRVRGTSLAVVTLAVGVAIQQFLFENGNFAGGAEGGRNVPTLEVFGIDLGILGRTAEDYPRRVFSVFVLVVLAATAVAVANLRRSRTGKMLVAVRSNERAAASLGFDVARAKLLASLVSSTIVGVGGVLIAYQKDYISPASFTPVLSLLFLAWAYLGGITSIAGAMVGGLLVLGGLVSTVLDQLVDFGEYAVLVSGLGVVTVAVLNARGLAGVPADVAELVRHRRVHRAAHS